MVNAFEYESLNSSPNVTGMLNGESSVMSYIPTPTTDLLIDYIQIT